MCGRGELQAVSWRPWCRQDQEAGHRLAEGWGGRAVNWVVEATRACREEVVPYFHVLTQYSGRAALEASFAPHLGHF